MMPKYIMVHQLRLKKCRILKNQELGERLKRRFQLNQREQREQIDENEYAYVQNNEGQNIQLISIFLEGPINNVNKVIKVDLMNNSPISRLEQYVQKKSDEIVYFYYKDLQLIPQFTLQQYNLQTDQVIQYRLIKKLSQNNRIQIFVKSVGDNYSQIKMSTVKTFRYLLEKMNSMHYQTQDFNLFYQNSLIDLESTPKQLGIKQGYILQYKHLLKLDHDLNTFHLSIIVQEGIQQEIQILQNQTPFELLARLFDQTSININNNYRLMMFNNVLQVNQTLVDQGVEEGDELKIVLQQEGPSQMGVNIFDQQNYELNDSYDKSERKIVEEKEQFSMKTKRKIVEEKEQFSMKTIRKIGSNTQGQQGDHNQQWDISEIRGGKIIIEVSEETIKKGVQQYQQQQQATMYFIDGVKYKIREGNQDNKNTMTIADSGILANQFLLNQQQQNQIQEFGEKIERIQLLQQVNNANLQFLIEQLQQQQNQNNRQPNPPKKKIIPWQEPKDKIQQKSWKIYIKKGLVVQFQCQNIDCPTKMSKIYQSFGLGNFNIQQLVCQCPECGNKLVKKKAFGVLVCEYQVTLNQKSLEIGQTNQLQFLQIVNQRQDQNGITIHTK